MRYDFFGLNYVISDVSPRVFYVLPYVSGFAVFSTRLDLIGNSVRGLLFAKELVDRFTFHMFDFLSAPGNCKNWTRASAGTLPRSPRRNVCGGP